MVVLGGSIAETRPHPDQPATHVVGSAYRGGSRVPGVRLMWVLRVAWVLVGLLLVFRSLLISRISVKSDER